MIHKTILIITTLFILISTFQVYAQADKFIKLSFEVSGRTIPYQLFIPENYADTIIYPLILSLHGSGDRGSDNTHVARMPEALAWSYPEVQNDNPCFILVPQCPYGSHWWNHYYDVQALLDYITDQYSIDLHRIYVTGTSLGAEGSWFMAQKAPYRFAAVVPSAGGGTWHALKILPYFPAMWIFHGRKDQTIPVEAARHMVAELEDLGNEFIFTHCDSVNCDGMTAAELDSILDHNPKFIYTEIEKTGHVIDDLTYNNPYLPKWLFKQYNENLPIADPIYPLVSVIDTSKRDFNYDYPVPNPVLKLGPVGSYDAAYLRSPVIIPEGDTLKMWYNANQTLSSSPASIAYAWSLDGITWQKHEKNPVIVPELEWEGSTLHEISIIKDGEIYKIWYGACSHPGWFTNAIGYATSPDGVNWTKSEQPVLLPGDSNDWDYYNITPGTVIKENGKYKMWYTAGNFLSYFQIGYAESMDGISWAKYNNPETNTNPYLNSDPVLYFDTTGIDRVGAGKPSVINTELGYEMYYTGWDLYQQRICYARSDDGITWKKHNTNPIVSQSPSWTESREMWEVCALKYNDITKIWFSAPQMVNGGDYTAYSEIGLLIIQNPSRSNSDNQYVIKFDLSQNYPNPYNPSTTIEFTLPHPEYTTLKIYNILGAEVTTLVSDKLQAGLHKYNFDGSKLASGVYYYQVSAGEFRDVKKMILLR